MRSRPHRKPFVVLAVVCLLATALVTTSAGAAMAAPKKPIAENVIVMIADGWGFNHDTAGSFYQYGAAEHRVWNKFPSDLAMSTYMAYDGGDCDGWGYRPDLAWADFGYANQCYTDSAAAATAMSTGVKTDYGSIGVDIDDNPVAHVMEQAEMHGKSTGVITSVQWTHATPAGFAAHNISRSNYAAIGTEMVYESALDVIMGAGHPFRNWNGDPTTPTRPGDWKYSGGEATWNDLVAGLAGGDADGDGDADPWVLIDERAAFQSLASGPTPDRVIGVAPVRYTLQEGRDGDGFADPFVVPFVATIPTLEEMTHAALNILDEDPDGFFLMVEGGAIDWASHANYSGRMIEEEYDFTAAVEAVMDWVKANSNWGETLLVVTADHETGYLTGPGSDPDWMPIVNLGAGTLPSMEWHSGDHTNNLVPFFAKGDAARMFKRYADEYDPVYGRYLDNIEMAQVLFWTLDPS